jgi:hypothetical protein
MAALQELIDKQKSSAEGPPQQPLPATGVTTPPPTAPPPSAPPPTTTTTTTGRADLVAQPAEKPVYKKAWFWGVIGGAAVVVAGGVVLGVVLGTRSNVQTLSDARL